VASRHLDVKWNAFLTIRLIVPRGGGNTAGPKVVAISNVPPRTKSKLNLRADKMRGMKSFTSNKMRVLKLPSLDPHYDTPDDLHYDQGEYDLN
jgi:hypothetical protein